jgi:hypothetical protein
MVGEAVAPPGSFLAGPGGGRSPLAHDDGPPAGVFGFTGGAGARPLWIGPVQGRDTGPGHQAERLSNGRVKLSQRAAQIVATLVKLCTDLASSQ